MEFSRLKHSLSVAQKMQKLAAQYQDKMNSSPEEMFTLGFVHDIGYQFSDSQAEHEECGGELLREQGYKFWREVFHHGDPDTEYESDELSLLNYADLTTGPDGEDMTISGRLDDIALRYGSDSTQYKKAKSLSSKFYGENTPSR